MENIEVGEYVRTKEGTIDIVRKYDDKLKFYWCQNGLNIDIRNQIATHLEDVVNHSKNIIDLIDVGDILKIKISEEWVEKQDTIKFVVVGQTYTITEIKECLENGLFKIIQILTKESYMANCYKVGGE